MSLEYLHGSKDVDVVACEHLVPEYTVAELAVIKDGNSSIVDEHVQATEFGCYG